MNVELLKRVAEVIVARPSDFQMRFVATDANMGSEPLWGEEDRLLFSPEESCGTACCIAGWTIALSGDGDPNNVDGSSGVKGMRIASELLNIDASQANRLFVDYNWPRDNYRLPYWDATTDAERAKVAYDRIHHFIQTEGKE